MFIKVIRASFACYASKLLGRLQSSHDKSEIRVLARQLLAEFTPDDSKVMSASIVSNGV